MAKKNGSLFKNRTFQVDKRCQKVVENLSRQDDVRDVYINFNNSRGYITSSDIFKRREEWHFPPAYS